MSKNRLKDLDINVNITDILTPKTCSVIVREVIKYLVYQQDQIPYPFDTLKYLVTKKKEMQSNPPETSNNDGENISMSSKIAAERHFKKAEETFTVLESFFKNIENELRKESGRLLMEVVVIFGSTPLHPSNTFRIRIPELITDHNEENHPHRRQLPAVFQAFFSSEELNTILKEKIGSTNIFILLKTRKDASLENELFHLKEEYQIPLRKSHVSIFINPTAKEQKCNCDTDFNFYAATPTKIPSCSNYISETIQDNDTSKECVDECNWYQYSTTIKGFKDCKIKGTLAENLWLKYSVPCNLTS